MTSPVLTVERYVLFEPIAVGGMATVYFARQRGAAGFSKAVAIKRMRPDLVHQREFVELFLDEARLASRVRHANVVSVIDVVASGEELLLVMEYFHGESLARLLSAAQRSKKPSPAIAVALVCNVLHGLHAAHDAKDDKGEPFGIIHRDVSPQNVIVGVDGVARVADFGIARAAGQIHATDEGKTRGKAGYSAPEQLRGSGITRKVDLFAACALLWEILVGRRLFDGESQAAIVTAVLTEPIDAPGLHVPALPEALDDVILRGLDRDPKRRPATALELAAALEVALPPAGPTAIAAWVAELAKEELDKRQEIVRRIESGVDAAGFTPAISPATDIARDPAGTGSLATSRSPSIAPPPRRSRAALAAVVIAATASIALAASFMTKAPSLAVATASSTPPAVSSPVLEASSPPPIPVVASVASRAPPASNPPPIAEAAPVDAGAPRLNPRTTLVRPAVTPRPGTKSKKCDPPYDLDNAGRKIFRPECL